MEIYSRYPFFTQIKDEIEDPSDIRFVVGDPECLLKSFSNATTNTPRLLY